MATAGKGVSGGGGGGGQDDQAVPVARAIGQDESADDVPIVVGEAVPSPYGARASTAVADPNTAVLPGTSMAVAQARPASTGGHGSNDSAGTVSTTGTWAVPGCGTRGYSQHLGQEPSRSNTSAYTPGPTPNVAQTGSSDMAKTGTWTVPGTGTRTYGSFPAAGVHSSGFRKENVGGGGSGRLSAAVVFDGKLRLGEGEHVDESTPVLLACGQGKSMYDVKGCLSSWVLVTNIGVMADGKGGVIGSGATDGVGLRKHEGGSGSGGGGFDSAVNKKLADLQLSGGPRNNSAAGRGWALRSEVTPAGDGGIMCASSLPFSHELSSGGGGSRAPKTLLTGGKDCILREWRVMDGRPRRVAEISGHTDWISCCALVPPDSFNIPPTAAVSGGRDGSVRLWSRSSAAAVDSNEGVVYLYNEENDSQCGAGAHKRRSLTSMLHASSSTAGGGGGSGSRQAEKVGMGGWYLANMMPGAHGSSEFVTCAAGPGAAAGASGGWVATGGTDWSVRLWDVVKWRELGRLSFRGHSHPVRSLAVSPDGSLLVSGGEDHKVIIWSPQSRRSIATLEGHASTVNGVAIDPGTQAGQSPRWVASGGGGGYLFVWDPRNWKTPVATLRGSTAPEDQYGPMDDGLSSLGSSERRFERSGSGKAMSGKWEGEAAGATMLNSVNCLAGGGAGGQWLFAAGETVVRAWTRRDGVWVGGSELPGEGLGGVSSLSVLD